MVSPRSRATGAGTLAALDGVADRADGRRARTINRKESTCSPLGSTRDCGGAASSPTINTWLR
jgi:hypothetical protein